MTPLTVHRGGPARRSGRRARFGALALACLVTGAAQAGTSQDAHGLWLSADKAAVIRFEPCSDSPTALCGKIVWDKDAGTPADACGVTIAKLTRYENDAWRNGWVLDPRTNKHYKGALRVQGEVLNLRAYIGTELLGDTEQMTRVQTLPAGCKSATTP